MNEGQEHGENLKKSLKMLTLGSNAMLSNPSFTTFLALWP
jgi:hypothetical protein